MFVFQFSPAVTYFTLFMFMGTYINKILKVPLNRAILSNFFCLLFVVMVIPIMGHISDKIGRKAVLLTGYISFAIFTYPLFVFIGDGNFAKLVFAQLVLGLFMAMYSGPGPAFTAEIFPTNVRVSTMSIGYNAAVALLGGTAPFVNTYLIKVTNNNIAPAFYVTIASVISVFAICTLPETYNKPLQ
jgi:MHS family proline/betaine transporter-like MFS transporter